eukprot:2234101-Heterocapsa_arctica.AAC.1
MRPSHVPWKIGICLTFCGICGSYCLSRRSPSLAAQCSRGASTAARKRQLVLLMAGQHPISRAYLGVPVAAWGV